MSNTFFLRPSFFKQGRLNCLDSDNFPLYWLISYLFIFLKPPQFLSVNFHIKLSVQLQSGIKSSAGFRDIRMNHIVFIAKVFDSERRGNLPVTFFAKESLFPFNPISKFWRFSYSKSISFFIVITLILNIPKM